MPDGRYERVASEGVSAQQALMRLYGLNGFILWRHAEAVEREAGQISSACSRGASAVRRAWPTGLTSASRIRRACWVIACCAASRPPRRWAASSRTVEAIALDAGPAAKAAAARWPESSEPVLVVGHQPTLVSSPSLLLAGTPQPWSVKKGAVWWLRSRDREGGAVVLHAVLGPDGL